MKSFISSMHWILTKPVVQTTSLHLCLKQLQRALQNHWLNCSLFRYQKVNSPNCGKLQALFQFQSPLIKAKVIQLSRPISLLSIMSKLLERIVHSILWEHLVEYAPISDMQWGIQKNRSTTSLLLHTTHDWFTLLDQQMEIMCFLISKRLSTLFHIGN